MVGGATGNNLPKPSLDQGGQPKTKTKSLSFQQNFFTGNP
jgi:hypothetical protein